MHTPPFQRTRWILGGGEAASRQYDSWEIAEEARPLAINGGPVAPATLDRAGFQASLQGQPGATPVRGGTVSTELGGTSSVVRGGAVVACKRGSRHCESGRV